MRPLLAILLVGLAALAAAAAGSSRAPAMTVSVTPSTPRAAGRQPSGRSDYAVSFRVSASSEVQCANLVVEYAYSASFDGRPSLAGSGVDYYETKSAATSAAFDVHAAGNAGDVVSFSGHATCENEDGDVVGTSQQVAARVAIPAHSCEEGPLRVLAARGRIRREGLLSRAADIPVRSGHYLWNGYHVGVAARSRIAFGAPECHGFRVVVGGPASFVPGDYASGGYGTSTTLGYGTAADFRGDQHSGGVETANAAILPRGQRTAPSKVARFVVVTLPKRLGGATRVRVESGAVYVAARAGGRRLRYGIPVVVRAGQSTVVSCARGCRPSRPR